jgi:hypothetical protein
MHLVLLARFVAQICAFFSNLIPRLCVPYNNFILWRHLILLGRDLSKWHSPEYIQFKADKSWCLWFYYLGFGTNIGEPLAAPSPPLGSIPVSVPVIPLSYCKVEDGQQPWEFVSSAVPFHLSACPSISSCKLNGFWFSLVWNGTYTESCLGISMLHHITIALIVQSSDLADWRSRLCLLWISAGTPESWLKFSCFSQSLLANSGLVPQGHYLFCLNPFHFIASLITHDAIGL